MHCVSPLGYLFYVFILLLSQVFTRDAPGISEKDENRGKSTNMTKVTIRQENTSRETSQAVKRRPGQILERHDLAKDSTRQANLEMAC